MTRKKIAIIGAGFSGIMTAAHLLNSGKSFDIFICGEKDYFARGIAYTPYSKIQLLNVIAAKMSAFADKPDDFLDFVLQHDDYKNFDRSLVANAFVPRYIYGDYLERVWKTTKENFDPKKCALEESHLQVTAVKKQGEEVVVTFENGESKTFDLCVLATGNQVPRNPDIKNKAFFEGKNYFQNPWSGESVENVKSDLPVLILGNGLTMVDTVLGLLEKKVKNSIISLSPNGFNILPHRHNGLQYGDFVKELKEGMSLAEISALVFKHIKKIRRLGISAEPLIDSLRPHTQRIWRQFSDAEKALFMSRFRHLWGVARHRIPLHIHDKIQQLRIENRLSVLSGRVINFEETENGVRVSYFDKRKKQQVELKVSRVINCTGPETDLNRLPNYFLFENLKEGLITQDPLKLGINASPESFEIIDANGNTIPQIRTLGGNLKGVLWESTAVNELRTQAERLAKLLAEQA
jgi:uncharacterized NAD(P)/FAD-binding protein YdhS